MLFSDKPISPATAYLLCALTASFWAGNFVVGRSVTVGTVPPLTLAWARWTGASLLILPFAWSYLARDWHIIRKRRSLLFFFGFIGAGVFNTLQYIALSSMTAVTGSVINSAGPVLIAVACWLILGERLSLAQVAGIVVSLLGVLVVVARGDVSALPAFSQSLGELIMLFGLILWAIYTALLRFRPAINPVSFAAATYVVAAIVNAPLMLWELFIAGAPINLSAPAFMAIGYVAIFPSLLAYLFFNLAVEAIGGARTSAFFHITPLLTAVLATLFLGETWQVYHLAGFVLILAGVWLTATRTA